MVSLKNKFTPDLKLIEKGLISSDMFERRLSFDLYEADKLWKETLQILEGVSDGVIHGFKPTYNKSDQKFKLLTRI